MIVFSTEKYDFLKKNILKDKKFKEGKIHRKNFEDGEKFHQVMTSVANQDVMIVGGTIDNDDMMEVYELSCAVIKYGAKTLHIVIPFFGYSTQERALKAGEIVKAKTRARMLSFIPQASNGNFIYLLEIHALGIPHYFEGSVHCQNIEINDLIIKQIKKNQLGSFVLASADMGNSKKIQTLASELNVETAFVIKKRHNKGVLSETTNNKIKDQTVLIYDDMIRSGKSVLEAVKIYKNEGAKKVIVMATHGVFCGDAFKVLLENNLVDKVIVSNSHPQAMIAKQKYPKKIILFDVIPVLIKHIN